MYRVFFLLLTSQLGFLTLLLDSRNIVTAQQQPSQCYDLQDATSCYYWQLSGVCRNHRFQNYMYQICRKTCSLCPSIYVPPYVVKTKKPVNPNACRDFDVRCSQWKEFCSEGHGYYNMMQTKCPRTCWKCIDPNCRDQNKNCERYEEYGYCEPNHKYFRFMRSKCARTCKFCTNKKIENMIRPKTEDGLRRNFACDFEKNECDWTNQYFEDYGDWKVGVDVNNKYAPKMGHRNSSQYIFTTALYRGYKSHLWLPWQLVIPEKFKSSSIYGVLCFHLVYQLKQGQLVIQEAKNPTFTDKQPRYRTIFSTGKTTSNWTAIEVNVHVTERYNLMIVGERYLKESYVIMDDFYFTQGRC